MLRDQPRYQLRHQPRHQPRHGPQDGDDKASFSVLRPLALGWAEPLHHGPHIGGIGNKP